MLDTTKTKKVYFYINVKVTNELKQCCDLKRGFLCDVNVMKQLKGHHVRVKFN